MSDLTAKLRWYPGDALKEIEEKELEEIGRKYGVAISMEEIKGKNLVTAGDVVFEDTRRASVEEVSQVVVTISAETEEAFKQAVRALVGLYRAPVPTWGLWGSTQKAQELAREVFDEDDGWG